MMLEAAGRRERPGPLKPDRCHRVRAQPLTATASLQLQIVDNLLCTCCNVNVSDASPATSTPPSGSDAIELVRSHSLTTLVQNELERLILSGELLPGTKLGEEDVALRLNVSRGPVREAFRALDQIGLVRIAKNRGVTVREISVSEADEIYELRAGLDELIGRLAAERVTREQVTKLRALIGSMEEAAAARDVDAYYPLNFEFHDLLASITGNRTLLATYRRLVKELHLFRRETLALGQDSFPTSVREHRQIVDALARGDGDQAGRLLYVHAIDSQARLHRIVSVAPAQTAPERARRRRVATEK